MPAPDPAPSPADDEVTAALEEIKGRHAARKQYSLGFDPVDAARLLAAIEAVLKPHQPGTVAIFGTLCRRHENHRFFSITSTEADDVRACPDCTATVHTSCAGCGPQVSVEACPVREAITRELTGKENP